MYCNLSCPTLRDSSDDEKNEKKKKKKKKKKKESVNERKNRSLIYSFGCCQEKVLESGRIVRTLVLTL